MKKCFSLLSFLLLVFVFNSCSLLNIDKKSTSSIVINFASQNQNRAVYTKDDLSYFMVSIEPKVQDDIKVDITSGQSAAAFTDLEEGFYKILVSAFTSENTEFARGESEQIEVKPGETSGVSIKLHILKDDEEDPESPTPEEDEEEEGDDSEPIIISVLVKVPGIIITGTETWSPSSEVFISGRQISIPNLLVSDHEVTRGEFQKIMGTDPSVATAYDKDGNELSGKAVLSNPVNHVNWYAAIAYCNKLSLAEKFTPCYSVEGITDWEALEFSDIPETVDDEKWNSATCNFEANGYRLPTEAEWEWLARGGQNFTYAGSNTVGDVAWYNSNSNVTNGVKGSREVKTKNANGYGLYDMSGNVHEWCWDWYETNLKSTNDGTGPSSGSARVTRGGNWGRADQYCEVKERNSLSPFTRNSYYGFRVVRTESPVISEPVEIDTFNWYESPIDAETGLPATASSTSVFFGVFPKSVVPESDSANIKESITKTVGAYTYYGDDYGNWYAKVVENSHGTSFKYTDETIVNKYSDTNPTTRYFKVEPIKWRVLTLDYNNSGNALLIAENVLIGNIPFYETTAPTVPRTINNVTVYANNYKYSTIRAYLNGKYETDDIQSDVYTDKGFLQTAFTSAAQSRIADTLVDNSELTTGYDSESYATYTCDDTTDKIFLLSMSEVVNTDYKFDPYNIVSDASNHKTRLRLSTDFARANNVYQSSATYNGYWWVRSPFKSSQTSVRAVTYAGALSGNSDANTAYYGIVPALTIAF